MELLIGHFIGAIITFSMMMLLYRFNNEEPMTLRDLGTALIITCFWPVALLSLCIIVFVDRHKMLKNN